MFSKLAILFTATLAIAVSAGRVPAQARDINNSCNAGPVQCCNDVHQSDSDTANLIHQIFGINIPITGDVGTQCSPITGAGAGSGVECSSQPMCCDNNHFEGLIAVGCSPINLNL